VRPANGSAAVLLDPPAGREQDSVPGGAAAPDVTSAQERELVVYHVLLLAGEPRHLTCTLPAGIEAGADIEVASGQWTVADVRAGREGASATLVCIYAE
jgi:hypothetical protein